MREVKLHESPRWPAQVRLIPTANLVSQSRQLRHELARNRADLKRLRMDLVRSVHEFTTKIRYQEPEPEITSSEIGPDGAIQVHPAQCTVAR